ncbi:MAG: ABC transporter permease, partial [bacterium]|nr:ABC transporter permease [bacterium]
MKYLFKLAAKNILRARRRTILTFMMLSFGIALFILMAGMLEGFDKASFKSMIDFETGHFKIRSTQFDEDRPYDIDNYIEDFSKQVSILKGLDFVTGHTGRILFLTEADNFIDSTPVVAIGIDPKTDKQVFSMDRYITGSLEKGGAIVGKALAKDLNLIDPESKKIKIIDGAMINLTKKSKNGMFTSVGLPVTGIIESADPKINNGTVYMNLDEAREFLAVPGATEISLKVNDLAKLKLYEKELEKAFSGMQVFSWIKLAEDFAALTQMKKKSTNVFILFIVIIAIVGIVNTLLMSVYEKKKEIGTLKALGMEDGEVRNLFIIEGLIIGFLGSIMGMILGTLFNLYFAIEGIDYTTMMGENADFGLKVMGVVKSTWEISAYIQAFVVSIIASVLASYYPAKKVTKMEPVECLRTL